MIRPKTSKLSLHPWPILIGKTGPISSPTTPNEPVEELEAFAHYLAVLVRREGSTGNQGI